VIYPDRVNVILRERKMVAGTATFVEVFNGLVPAIVTFMDSNLTFDPSSGGKLSSRLRIILKPFSYKIPPNVGTNVTISWKEWTSLQPDGAVELHYFRGRLHHYEILAKAV